MTESKVARSDLLAGLFVFGLGLFAVWEASAYPFGSLRSIGSGFFPVMLGFLAMSLGLGILWEASTRPVAEVPAEQTPSDKIELRSMAAILGAILAFAILVDRAGLAAAIFAAVFTASLAEQRFHPVSVFVLAIGLVVLCVAVFIYGLTLPFRIFAW